MRASSGSRVGSERRASAWERRSAVLWVAAVDGGRIEGCKERGIGSFKHVVFILKFFNFLSLFFDGEFVVVNGAGVGRGNSVEGGTEFISCHSIVWEWEPVEWIST